MPRALWVKSPFALLRHRVGLIAVVATAALVAVGAAAGPLMNAGAESEALKSKLAQLTPLGAGLVITRESTPEAGGARGLAAADRRRREAALALGRTLPSAGRPVLTTTSSAQLAGPLRLGNPLAVVAMARTGVRRHVQKLAGSGIGVWLSERAAQDAGVRLGRPVTFVQPTPAPPDAQSVTLPFGAVYRPLDLDLANPYWVNFTARIRSRNPDASPPPSFALVSNATLYRLASAVGGNAVGNVYEFPIETRSMTPQRARQVARVFENVRLQLVVSSPLATALGCGAQSQCTASSELTDAVRLAAAGNSSLSPVIDLLAGFCILIALSAALIAGVFTGRRRAAEARLSLVGGEPRPAFLGRAAIEAFLPAVCGAAAGFAIAVELVRLFTPQGSVDSSVVQQTAARALVAAVAAALAVAVGMTVARGRLGAGGTRWSRIARVPWEPVVLAGAVASWLLLLSGNGLVKDRVAGSHPRLVVFLLPALVAAPLTGLTARVLRPLAGRRLSVRSVAVFLAARRVAAARGLVVVLTVAIAAGVASLAFANILRSSLETSSREKGFAANGSDVQGLVDASRSLPRRFPYPVTTATEVFGAGQLADGRSFEAITVDPPTLERVLAKHWPASLQSAVRKLAAARGPLPAIAVGVPTGRHVVTLGDSQAVVNVVARVRAFPGLQPGLPLLVIPVRALAQPPIGSLAYVWATGPPAKVVPALARSSLAPQYLTVVTDFSRQADVQNITRTYGFLRLVASGIVLLSLIALMLYLAGRGRAQRVAGAFLYRMGVSRFEQASSVALESSFLVVVAAVVGMAAGIVTAQAIVTRVDPLSQFAPSPTADTPWLLLAGTVVALTAVAALLSTVATLAVRRSEVGEDLRVS